MRRGELHSARTKGFSFTKSGNVVAVRDSTSEAAATAAETRPRARLLKECMLTVWKVNGHTVEQSVCLKTCERTSRCNCNKLGIPARVGEALQLNGAQTYHSDFDFSVGRNTVE